MTWSYSWDQLATNPVYAVRLEIGDIVSCDPQLQDEEIAYFISKRSSLYGACAECCRSLASKFSRSVDTAAGGNKASFSQLAKAYVKQTLLFEQRAALGGAGMPYAGGISVADMLAQMQNDDRVPSNFTVGMHENLLPVPPTNPETEEERALGGINE